jgi:hypothetical protein
MAGPGRAVPDGTRSFTCLRKDMTNQRVSCVVSVSLEWPNEIYLKLQVVRIHIKYTLHWEYLLKYSKVIVDFDHYFIAGRRGCYHCGLSAKERP